MDEKKIFYWDLDIDKRRIKEQSLDDSVFLFGFFNVLHPGHIRYFDEAERLSKKIWVVVQADPSDSRSDKSTVYSVEDRCQSILKVQPLASLIIAKAEQLEAIDRFCKPYSWMFGKDFENRKDAFLQALAESASKRGAMIHFRSGGVRYAVSDFSGRHDGHVAVEKSAFDNFRKVCTAQNIDLEDMVRKIRFSAKPRIAVLGDLILDRYISCDAVGLSSEAPVMVLKELRQKSFIGAAGIVALHIGALGADVSLVSVVGADPEGVWLKDVANKYGLGGIIQVDDLRPTSLKTRYMVEYQKILRVSRLDDQDVDENIESCINRWFEDAIEGLDAVVVSDFSYGVVTDSVLDYVEKLCKDNQIPLLGDSQSSSQIGDVSRFKNYCVITPTEKEARLATGMRDDGMETVARKLVEMTNCENLVLKAGRDGFIVYGPDDSRTHFPALNSNPIDLAGAGDSLLAAITYGIAIGLSINQAAAFGNIVVAESVGQLGNNPIDIERILEYLP